jgi:hypothetical protein
MTATVAARLAKAVLWLNSIYRNPARSAAILHRAL